MNGPVICQKRAGIGPIPTDSGTLWHVHVLDMTSPTMICYTIDEFGEDIHQVLFCAVLLIKQYWQYFRWRLGYGATIDQFTDAFFCVTGWNITGPGITWWRNQMETFSALLALCAENSPVTDGAQRPVTLSFDAFFDLRLNKRVNNREIGDLRRHRAHYDVTVMRAGTR